MYSHMYWKKMQFSTIRYDSKRFFDVYQIGFLSTLVLLKVLTIDNSLVHRKSLQTQYLFYSQNQGVFQVNLTTKEKFYFIFLCLFFAI